MKRYLVLLLVLFPIKVFSIDVSAKSAIMMDMDSKRIIYSKNINEQRSVASISKIMTAVLAIESGKLDDYVLIGDEVNKSYGSSIYIKKGEKIKLRDLVYGLMLRSGNDASLVIANYIDKNNFVKKMNAKANEIGMINTIFNNPNGLDEENGNYSTAYDMAILTSYAMKLEEYRNIVRTKEYSIKTNLNTYKWLNKNKLLFTYDNTTGGKTGYTDKAKRTLVTTASKNNINLVVVTLVDSNDFIDHKKLFEYGFSNFYNINILKKGYLPIHDSLYYNKYKLYIDYDYNYLLTNNDKVYINYELSTKPTLGKTGIAKVYLNNKLLYYEDIYAENIKDRKSIWSKLKIW